VTAPPSPAGLPAAQPRTGPVIARAESVTRTFGSGPTAVRALRGVSLSVARGELVALRGRSGSGKSTLLSILGGLIPILSAAENVGIPMRLARMDPATRERRARALLGLVGLVGLDGRADLRPYELSGGEQQRVAIARALANTPTLLLADEPTGQLDSDTAGQIMRPIRSIVHDEGITAIVATHDPVLTGLADRVLNLRDGVLC
jgi:putative ABC transport system ATP-binding protein